MLTAIQFVYLQLRRTEPVHCIVDAFFCVSLVHLGLVFSNVVLLGFSVPSQEIGWEERVRNDLFLSSGT